MKPPIPSIIFLIITLTLLSSVAHAQPEPPELFMTLHGQEGDTLHFGTEFCNIGDQNGDGYDDILVTHDPKTWSGDSTAVNLVKLYYGGEEMDNDPDMLFEAQIDSEAMAYRLFNLGDLTGEGTKWFGIESLVYQRGVLIYIRVKLYEGGENLDNEPEFILQGPYDIDDGDDKAAYFPEWGWQSRPADFNGDGYDDMILAQQVDDTLSQIVIFHGGEDFDTIPDWKNIMAIPDQRTAGITFSKGYDVNADGYEDVLVKYMTGYWELFLGGDPMDTTSVVSFQSGDWEDWFMFEDFALLQDVNDDGYDDWGVFWKHVNREIDGYLIFYGSEEPDGDYDLNLEGNQGIMGHEGRIKGGDFNGDGIGDIVTGLENGFMGDGEINIFFGSRWINSEARIVLNLVEEYGDHFRYVGEYLGAVGDYNGDGADDFAIRHQDNDINADPLFIFAGSREWDYSAPLQNHLLPNEISLRAFPNPFNSTTVINVSIPFNGNMTLEIYDVTGRLVNVITSEVVVKGSYNYSWQTEMSGVYFAVLSLKDGKGQEQRMVKKLVAVK